MSAEMLKRLIGSLPFARVLWGGDDGKVVTVQCEIPKAQQLNWEKLAVQWLSTVQKPDRLFIAHQIVLRGGQGLYVWNISIWSADPDRVVADMYNAMQGGAQAAAAVTPSQANRKGKVEDLPEYRQAQTSHLQTRKRDAVSEERVRAERARGEKYAVTIPLPGATTNRNTPTRAPSGIGTVPYPGRGAFGIGG